jgi:hypothetical protein
MLGLMAQVIQSILHSIQLRPGEETINQLRHVNYNWPNEQVALPEMR